MGPTGEKPIGFFPVFYSMMHKEVWHSLDFAVFIWDRATL